jgi:hypothetical protein
MIVKNQPKLTKLADVAKMLGLPAYALRADVKAKRLPAKRIGGRIYLDVESDLKDYLDRAAERAGAPAPRTVRVKTPTRASEVPTEPKP